MSALRQKCDGENVDNNMLVFAMQLGASRTAHMLAAIQTTLTPNITIPPLLIDHLGLAASTSVIG